MYYKKPKEMAGNSKINLTNSVCIIATFVCFKFSTNVEIFVIYLSPIFVPITHQAIREMSSKHQLRHQEDNSVSSKSISKLLLLDLILETQIAQLASLFKSRFFLALVSSLTPVPR